MLNVIILTVIPELTQDEFYALLPFVSPEKQERIKRFHFFRDSRNCLLADILTRSEICHVTGLSNKKLEFSTNEFGKPFLINNPDIHFNISHAGHYIVCALSDGLVGIDIELIRPIDIAIAKRFFSPDEATYILNGNQEKLFYEVWTKKESHIKWDGKGLYKPLSSFSVLNPDGQEHLCYQKIFEDSHAVSHVCSTLQLNPSVKMFDTTSFLEDIKL